MSLALEHLTPTSVLLGFNPPHGHMLGVLRACSDIAVAIEKRHKTTTVFFI